MLQCCLLAALSWSAQRQAHQLLQAQRHHHQLYGSLLAAAAAAAVSQRAMLVRRQHTAPKTAPLSDDLPVKKPPAIWSPATDIENNNKTDYGQNDDAMKWEIDSDQTKMR